MNEELVWRFDVAVFEWLIVLAMLVILAIVRCSGYSPVAESIQRTG